MAAGRWQHSAVWISHAFIINKIAGETTQESVWFIYNQQN